MKLPPEITPTHTNLWYDERRAFYDAYELAYRGCSLTLAARSDGLVRPSGDLPLAEGEHRILVPAESATPGLEIVTTPTREFESLGFDSPAVGAAVFESDGTATDFFLFPRLPAGQDFPPCQDDCTAEARADPRLARCFEVAETLLRESMSTLRAVTPFSTGPNTLAFGWDEATDSASVYQGVLPAGWIISRLQAFDGSVDRVHRRQTWSWSREDPTPRAEVWMFSDEGDQLPRSARRARLFGHAMRFNTRGCAEVEIPAGPLYGFVCLTGSEAERDELVAVLQTFTRINRPDESP